MRHLIYKNFLITIFFLATATALAFLFFHFIPENSANIALSYILSLILIARYTAGYWYGVFAALFSVICVNFLFTYPYFQLNFSLTGYPITFLGMLTITIITTAGTTRIKQQAEFIVEHERKIEEAEREKLRANLLRAVSHDLRTPLTGIIGASSSYLENKAMLSEDEKLELVTNINNDSNWLLNMVENLLSVTRIQDNPSKVRKIPEVVEEVVSEATLRLQKRLPNAVIHVHVPVNFLMVPMDAILIEQVLINLMENAVTHSGSSQPTELIVTEQMDTVTFEVKDFGHGLDESQLDHLFQGTYASSDSTDTHKGMGIGLSICKTIIEAHNGEIMAKNHPTGAVFSFTLPKGSEEDS